MSLWSTPRARRNGSVLTFDTLKRVSFTFETHAYCVSVKRGTPKTIAAKCHFSPVNSSGNLSMTNVQFVQCGTALKTANASFYAGNILMSRVGAAFYGQNFQGQVEQLTFDQGNHVTEDPNGAENGVSYLNLVNSLLTSVTDYGVVQVNTTDVAKLPNGSGIYQVAGAGSYYLDSGGAYHNAGTPAINNRGLLAQLSQKTTYPPTVYAGTTFSTATSFSPTVPRQNSGVPDYGYHYDPLDVAFGGVTANANLTFTPGTAAGWFGSSLCLRGQATALDCRTASASRLPGR